MGRGGGKGKGKGLGVCMVVGGLPSSLGSCIHGAVFPSGHIRRALVEKSISRITHMC